MSRKIDFNETRYSDWHVGVGDRPRIRKIVALAGYDKTVLDIGCGTGEIGKALIQKGHTVYGVDISRSAVNKAISVGVRAKYFDVDKDSLPFQDHFFDIVLAAEILEHVFDTDMILEKIKKKLKKHGEFIITTPNLASLGRRLLLLFGQNPLIEVNLDKHSAGHVRYFVKDTLLSLLHTHGFHFIHYSSDIVNFTRDGSLNSRVLAQLVPTLGRSIIIKATLRQ